MADLEERILKSNVPGRYTGWDEDGGGDGGFGFGDGDGDGDGDDDDGGGGGGGGGFGEDSQDAASSGPPPGLPPRRSAGTGAKGVLADRRAAREEEAYRLEIERDEREAVLERAARGARMRPGEASVSVSSVGARAGADRRAAGEAARGDGSGDGSDDGSDEFLRSFRRRRLEELRSGAGRRPTPPSPLHGRLEDATPAQYSEAADATSASPASSLVVHLHEPHLPACAEMDSHLRLAAKAVPGARFLRLRAGDARPGGFDPVGLPSVLVHRGGRLVANLTPVTEHLPGRYGAGDVLELLRPFLGPQGPPPPFAAASAAGGRGLAQGHLDVDGGYDSDDAELDAYCADFELS